MSPSELQHLLPSSRRDGGNIYGKCPKCGGNEFGISVKHPHRFGCFRLSKCGFSGNIFTLLKYLGLRVDDYKEPVDLMATRLPFGISKEEEEIALLPEEIKPPVLWRRVFTDEYLESRGITEEQFKRYSIGTSMLNEGYITFLVEVEGKVRGYVSRSKKSREWHDNHPLEKRYDNSKTDFSRLLYGFDEIDETTQVVLLVEGVIDKLSVDTLLDLYQQQGIVCCATFGGKVADGQLHLLKKAGVENIVLLFESDIVKKVKKVLDKVGSKFKSVKVGCLPEGKDPNNLSQEEMFQVMEQLEDIVSYRLRYLE
jgi:hypothetical protein